METKVASKTFDDDVMSKIVTSSSFPQFIVNLEQSGGRFLEAQSVKRIFSLTIIFYLTKI